MVRPSGLTIRSSTRSRRGKAQPARGKAQSLRGRGRPTKVPDAHEDAISDVSSTYYENVSDDDQEVVLAIPDCFPSQKKRARPDDGPPTLNDLLDQQLDMQKKTEQLQKAQDLNAERIRVLASITESQPLTSQVASQRHSPSNVYGGNKGKSTVQHVTSPLVVFPATNPTSVIMEAVELPTLTPDLAKLCKDLEEHVHLADLSPYNRDLDQSVHYRRSTADNPREEIRNIIEWIRAFIVFAAYRQSVNPQFCLPFLNYMDLITSMAERDEPWLVYDENFRRYAISKPLDTAVWCRVHERSYQNAKPRLPVSARLGLPSNSKSFSNKSCFSCGEPNWTREHHCKRSSNQPFRTGAAATAAPGEVCFNWNRGFCFNGDNCPRRHICSECYANGRKVTIHTLKNHPKVQYKVPSDEPNCKSVDGDKNST